MSALGDLSEIVVSYALEAIFEGCLSEIHQQPQWQLHESKIGQDLLAMQRRKPIDGFQFTTNLPSINKSILKALSTTTPLYLSGIDT